jgi:hypothetical protein
MNNKRPRLNYSPQRDAPMGPEILDGASPLDFAFSFAKIRRHEWARG